VFQHPLGTRYLACAAVVYGDGGAEGLAEGFEDGFDDVVGVVSGKKLDVEGEASVGGEGAEEFGDEFGVEGANFGGGELALEGEQATPTEVAGDEGEGFVHGDDGVAVATDTGFVAEGLGEGFAEDDADVFDGVVVVNMVVAGGLEFQVEEAVVGDVVEHVVEKADACLDFAVAVAVEAEREGDVGLVGLAAAEDGVAGLGHKKGYMLARRAC
jgi:hypothetical protein